MKVLSLLFHLGVVFAGFAFLWFWIELLIKLVLPLKIRVPSKYILKLLKSLFLGTLVLKFNLMQEGSLAFNTSLTVSLLAYFLYMIRSIKNENSRFKVKINSNMQARVKTNVKLEWSIAFSSLLVTLIWLFYPKMLDSATTEWFYTKTHYLLSVPLLGWVFRISGLFFVIGTILRFVSALFWIVKRPKKKIDPEEFDDFEEL